jgi:hypothetical protein
MSKPTIQDQISYLKKHPLKTVKIKGFHQLVHPDAMVIFTCKKAPMLHGEFWLQVNEAKAAEERGESACAMCHAVSAKPEDDVVPFDEFKEQVTEQRKRLKKAGDKGRRAARRSRDNASRMAS